MILEEKYNAIREEGLEEGRKEGLEEGRKTGIEEGRKTGFEEGHAAGIQEGIKNTIMILKELNLPEEDIIARLLEKYPGKEEFIRKIINA